jgi:hypothetical protein
MHVKQGILLYNIVLKHTVALLEDQENSRNKTVIVNNMRQGGC